MSRRLPTLLTLAAALALFGVGALSASAATPTTEVVSGSPAQVHSLEVYDGALYFSAFDGASQVLHRFDGGTVSAVPGSPTFPANLGVAGSDLYLSAGGQGLEASLWVFDGTAFGEIPGTDGIGILQIVGYNGDVYFTDFADTLHVYDLPAGTVSIVAGAPTGGQLTPYGGLLYFSTTLGALWQIDGSGTASEVPDSSINSGILGIYGGLLYSQRDEVLTSYDGADFAPVPGSPMDPYAAGEYDGVFYVVGSDGTDYMLHAYDGSAITAVPGSPPDAAELVAAGGRLYFVQTEEADRALWSYDGAAFTPLPPSLFNQDLTAYAGTLYFSGSPTGNEGDDFFLQRVVDAPELPATGAGDAAVLVGAALVLGAAGAVTLTIGRRRQAH